MEETELCITTNGHSVEKPIWTLDDNRFVDDFEKRIADTINTYAMISPSDKVVVAVSGGKDSTVVLHVLRNLSYPVEAITVNAHIGCYTDENLKNIRMVCASLNVPLHEISFRKVFGASLCHLRDLLKERGFSFKSCTVCGVLRRYLLNTKARELGATKIVLGHNLDDEAQAIVMNMLKNRMELSARSGPITKGTDKRFIPRIKPLFFIPENDIIRYSKLHAFPVHYGKCPCSVEGFRNTVRDSLRAYECVVNGSSRRIVENVLMLVPALKKNIRKTQMCEHDTCTECGEPSTGVLCRACQLLSHLHGSAEHPHLLLVKEPPVPDGQPVQA